MKNSSEGLPEGESRRPGGVDRFLSAFTLVSRLPYPGRFVYDQSRLDFHLPLVGVPVVALAATVAALASSLDLPSSAAALALLVVQYGAFNLFHLDGFMDSADALLGHGDREKRLAILKDSRIGVYAFFAGFCLLSLKLILLRQAVVLWGGTDWRIVAALFAYPVAGRAAAALVPTMATPARKEGLGAQAASASVRRVGLGTALSCLLVALPAYLVSAVASEGLVPPLALPLLLAVPASALLSAAAVARSYRRGVGGYTGDALGAAVETAEVLHLLLCLGVLRLLG